MSVSGCWHKPLDFGDNGGGCTVMVGCVKLCVLAERDWCIWKWQKPTDLMKLTCRATKRRIYQRFSAQHRRFEFDWTKFTALRQWRVGCRVHERWFRFKLTAFAGWNSSTDGLRCATWWPNSCRNQEIPFKNSSMITCLWHRQINKQSSRLILFLRDKQQREEIITESTFS